MSTTETGLIGIPERVQISDEADGCRYGWDVEYLMNAAINIDDYAVRLLELGFRLDRGQTFGCVELHDLPRQGGVHILRGLPQDIPNGYSYVGPARNVLTKACETSGLVWSINNGVLQTRWHSGGTPRGPR